MAQAIQKKCKTVIESFQFMMFWNTMDADCIMECVDWIGFVFFVDNIYCLKDKGKDKDLFQTSSNSTWTLSRYAFGSF